MGATKNPPTDASGRRTAKSRIEHSQAECWVPGNVVGGGSDRQLGIGAEAMDREGGVVDRRQAGGEARPPGVVAVLVPPSILQEVKAVFHSPMVANIPQEVRCGNTIRIEARDEVSHVVREDFAVGGANLAINSQR